MSLQSLPVEIIEQIVDDSPQRDIIGLLKSCRDLHTIVEPLFYRSISNISFGYKFPDEPWPFPRMPPFGLLLRTLLCRPDLGEHVRSFGAAKCASFSYAGCPSTMFNQITGEEMVGYNEYEMELLRQRAHALHIEEKHLKPRSLLAARLLGMFNRLILSFCTRLRQLYSAVDFRELSEMQAKRIFIVDELHYKRALDRRRQVGCEEAVTPRVPLPVVPMVRTVLDMSHLTHLNIPGYKLVWNSHVVTSVFNLPNIESIKVSLSSEQVGESSWSNVRASKLRRLHLFSSEIDAEIVCCIVSSAGNLRELILDLAWDSGIRDITKLGSMFPDPDTPSSGADINLCHVATEKLELFSIYILNRLRESSEIVFTGTLGSLKGCKMLRTLNASPIYLFGQEPKVAKPWKSILPDSLRSVTLATNSAGVGTSWHCWKDEDLREHFLEFAKDGRFGALKRVRLYGTPDMTHTDLAKVAKWKTFCETCEKSGVEVQCRKETGNSWEDRPEPYYYNSRFDYDD